MRTKLILATAVAALAATASADAAPHRAASAEPVCVGSRPGCFAQIQPAIDAARAGSTIRIASGTFAGGVSIDKSLHLVGAGASATIIKGGGPVLTLGTPGADREPTVTIAGVTVTGGDTVGNLDPTSGRGGGIYIPRAAGPSTGATVTIRDSVIRGNRVTPAESTDSGLPCDCPFASAGGGGISNDGNLTLDHTIVAANVADAANGLTSDADGGGILNRAFGNLTLIASTVTDNRAEVSAPNGRFADGGGISMVAGVLTVRDSVVSSNVASLRSAFESGVETAALAGGIHTQSAASALLTNTTVRNNRATAANPVGDAVSFCGGICSDGSLVVRGGRVSGNSVNSTVAGNDASHGFVSADSAGIGIGCCSDEPAPVSLTGTSVSGNHVHAASGAGDAFAAGGALSMANIPAPAISDSTITANRVNATSTAGSVTVRGGAIQNGGQLNVADTEIDHNSATADAPTGTVEGGGIWNGAFDSESPDPVLSLTSTAVTQNTLNTGPGLLTRGGGLFTTAPVTLRGSAIAGNSPDECFGC